MLLCYAMLLCLLTISSITLFSPLPLSFSFLSNSFLPPPLLRSLLSPSFPCKALLHPSPVSSLNPHFLSEPWFGTAWFWDINVLLSHERVAQNLRPDSWLFWNTVQRLVSCPVFPVQTNHSQRIFFSSSIIFSLFCSITPNFQSIVLSDAPPFPSIALSQPPYSCLQTISPFVYHLYPWYLSTQFMCQIVATLCPIFVPLCLSCLPFSF